MFKLPTLTLITVAGSLVATAETSPAAVVNGSFETGKTEVIKPCYKLVFLLVLVMTVNP